MSTTLYVTYENPCIDYREPDEEFGEWSTELAFNLLNVQLTKPDVGVDFETFVIPQNVDVDDLVFVLYMTYGEGDSFGHCSGKGEILWVFDDIHLANDAARAWSNSSRPQTIEFNISNDQQKRLSNPAHGYFEELESVNILEFRVEK